MFKEEASKTYQLFPILQIILHLTNLSLSLLFSPARTLAFDRRGCVGDAGVGVAARVEVPSATALDWALAIVAVVTVVVVVVLRPLGCQHLDLHL